MSKRRRNGPGVFLLALGSVVLLSGLLTFLALPAAKRMDAKKAEQDETPLTDARQRSIVRGGIYAAGAGSAMVAVGLVLVFMKAPRT